jgi:hypothetical protein
MAVFGWSPDEEIVGLIDLASSTSNGLGEKRATFEDIWGERSVDLDVLGPQQLALMLNRAIRSGYVDFNGQTYGLTAKGVSLYKRLNERLEKDDITFTFET